MGIGRHLREADKALSEVEKTIRSEEPNYLVEAFKSQYNLIALGTAVGFAILSGSFLPLVLAAGVELTVLPLVERMQRYRRARRLEDDKRERRRTEMVEMLRALTDEERRRYSQLEGLAVEIRQNYTGLDPSSRILVDELVGKLDFLLSFYLRMRHSIVRYQRYFATTDPAKMKDRITRLEQEIASGPERVQQIKARTRAVLMKRLERYQKALDNRQLIDAQTETVQEVLQLLRDQSYSMRDPRSITEQLDGLVHAAEETERGVRDMEELLELERDVLLPAGLTDEDEELEPERPARTAQGQAAPPPAPLRTPSAASAPPPPPPPRKKIIQ